MTDQTYWACALDKKRPVPEQLAWMTDLYAELHGVPPTEAHVEPLTAERVTAEVGIPIVVNSWIPKGSIYFPIVKEVP